MKLTTIARKVLSEKKSSLFEKTNRNPNNDVTDLNLVEILNSSEAKWKMLSKSEYLKFEYSNDYTERISFADKSHFEEWWNWQVNPSNKNNSYFCTESDKKDLLSGKTIILHIENNPRKLHKNAPAGKVFVTDSYMKTMHENKSGKLTESVVDLSSLEPSPGQSDEYPSIKDISDATSMSELTYNGKPISAILKKVLNDLWERINVDIASSLDNMNLGTYEEDGYSTYVEELPELDDVKKALIVSDIVYIPSGEIGIVIALNTHRDDIEDVVEDSDVCGMYAYDLDTLRRSRIILPKKTSGNYQLEDVSEFQIDYAIRLDFDYSNLTEDIHSDFLNAMEDLNEDISSIASSIKKFSSDVLNKLKSAFSGNIQEAASWLKRMLASGVSVAITAFLITSLASCTSNKDALRRYQDPKFIAKIKQTDPKYYKYIYYETTDSTGKTVAKIRKQHLTNPAMFGKEPNQSDRGKSCLRGGHCPTYGSADVSKGYGYGEHAYGE